MFRLCIRCRAFFGCTVLNKIRCCIYCTEERLKCLQNIDYKDITGGLCEDCFHILFIEKLERRKG